MRTALGRNTLEGKKAHGTPSQIVDVSLGSNYLSFLFNQVVEQNIQYSTIRHRCICLRFQMRKFWKAMKDKAQETSDLSFLTDRKRQTQGMLWTQAFWTSLFFFLTETSSWLLFVHGTRLHKGLSVHIAIIHWASGLFLLAKTSRPGIGWESCNPPATDLRVHPLAVGFNWKASASVARRRVFHSRDQRKETSSTHVYRRCLFSPFLNKDKDVTFGFSLLESHSRFKFKVSALLRIVGIRGKHYCLCGYQSCKWLGQKSLPFLSWLKISYVLGILLSFWHHMGQYTDKQRG